MLCPRHGMFESDCLSTRIVVMPIRIGDGDRYSDVHVVGYLGFSLESPRVSPAVDVI